MTQRAQDVARPYNATNNDNDSSNNNINNDNNVEQP